MAPYAPPLTSPDTGYDQHMASPPEYPAPPPGQPYLPPPPTPSRGPWIILTGIVLAAALILTAVLLAGGTKDDTTTPPSLATPTAPTSAAPAAASSTCEAWRTAFSVLDAIPALPPGWNWDTPYIDTLISNRNAAATRVLDIFEPKIADQPADVAAAARTYVAERRKEMRLLSDHSYSAVDAVAGNVALGELNQLCGTN